MYRDDLLRLSMEIIEAVLFFKKKDVDISSDLHLARAKLQRYVLSLGVLSPMEDFVVQDLYSRHCFNLDGRHKKPKDNGKNAKFMAILMRTLHEGNRKLAMQSLSARPALSRVLVSFLEMPETRGGVKKGGKLSRDDEDSTEHVESARYVLMLLNSGDDLTEEV